MATQDLISGASSSRPTGHGTATAGAELAAYNLCKQPLNLTGRKPVEGFAIDSADPASPMDRDDAVSIRFSHDADRGYVATLDVSIADVAATSPQAHQCGQNLNLAALDKFAHKNGESLYFPHGVSPMLPRRLQDRLSLENGKERAAITISVTLDTHCNTIHTEFSRTRIKAKCRSYRDAARDILIHGHPIQQISVVANQLLKRKSGVTNLPHYDERTGMYTDAEGNIRHISRDELSAFTTVQGTMIAANEAAAQLMSQSNFLFRNHSYTFRNSPVFYSKKAMETFEGSEGRIIQNKAEYSHKCQGHFGLDAEKYSHITSPMRRYADLVNQRMILWAIEVVDVITDSIVNDSTWNRKKYSRKKVAYTVWAHAKELLGRASAFKEARGNKARLQGNMEHAIAAMIAGMGHYQLMSIVETASDAISAIHLPYTSKQLAEIAETLNATLAKNRVARREMQLNETNAWLDKVFPSPDIKMLKAWGADNFARLLAAAARRGDNHDIFETEVSLRLKEDKDSLVQNLYSILAVAQRHKDSHWQELKKQAFQMLKDESGLGEKVFAHMQRQREFLPQHREDTLESQSKHSAQIFILEATLLDRHKHRHPSALVVLVHEEQEGMKDYSAPIIDTADTPSKARQAAILTFFRHYGDLYPHQQLYTPKLIDLALERAKVRKGGRLNLLRKICATHFTIEEHRKTYDNSPDWLELTLSVISQEGGYILKKTRAGSVESYLQIVDKAAKDMLEDRRFLDMLSQCHTWIEADGKMVEDFMEPLPRILWNHLEDARIIDRRPPTHH